MQCQSYTRIIQRVCYKLGCWYKEDMSEIAQRECAQMRSA